jgi:hypothetical protein
MMTAIQKMTRMTRMTSKKVPVTMTMTEKKRQKMPMELDLRENVPDRDQRVQRSAGVMKTMARCVLSPSARRMC